MKDWKKQFDEKFKDYVIGFSEDSDYNLELSGFEFYEEFHKELIAFISKVETDAVKRTIDEIKAKNAPEIKKANEHIAKIMVDSYERGKTSKVAIAMNKLTPKLISIDEMKETSNQAYERAAKVAEKECDCTASWDISCHSTKTAQSIRSLKDD